MTSPHPFAAWLAEEVSRRGYDLNRFGEKARFARDAGLNDSSVSRLLRGDTAPDIKSCQPIASVLGCRTIDVLAAAGLIPASEVDETSPPPTPREHLVGLVGNDTAAQDAVIVLLRALGKWAP